MSTQNSSLIKNILKSNDTERIKTLFAFDSETSTDLVAKKFKLFSRVYFSRYFTYEPAPFHDDMVLDYIKAYRGESIIELAFRGASKTSLLKLVLVFLFLNDKDKLRKYIKILSRDLKNSRAIVTDVYNAILELEHIYGDVFEKEGKKKREETMASFTTKDQRKISAGTVGQAQRGHIQDAYRPDFLIFEDIEDRQTISSQTITQNIIDGCDEALTGTAFDYAYIVNGNYISDAGVIEWFLQKQIERRITPILIGDKPTWERYTPEIIEKLKQETNDWAGEYLCDPTRIGDKFFDIDLVEHMLATAKKPEKIVGISRYWSNYSPQFNYGGAMDLSDGVGKDSCALAFFNFTTGELIISADTNTTEPDIFTFEAVRIGTEFGNCVLAPETNNTCGGIAIRVLKEKEYPNIYRREFIDKTKKVVSNTYGWHTNSKTKPDMFYRFKKDFNNGLITIYDERVLKEMKAFTNQDLQDTQRGVVTRHFDLLTAVCIAWMMKDHAKPRTSVRDFYIQHGID